MKALRGTLALALLVALIGPLARPAGAMSCRSGSCCPLMAKRVSVAPCHRSTGGFAAPMDCCRRSPAPVPTTIGSMSGASDPLPVATLAPEPAVADLAPPASTESDPRAARLHALGLFTLHSVWRI